MCVFMNFLTLQICLIFFLFHIPNSDKLYTNKEFAYDVNDFD